MSGIQEQYKKSGNITRKVREVVKSKVAPGMSYLDACELVSKEVRARGGALAFPTGIGVNEVTAHYAPQGDDKGTFRESDLVKVDFGVHVDGYVTDTAVSVTWNPQHQILLDAAESALEIAISTARRDRRTGEIGREIRREASRLGLKTIENLTGHTLDRYTVHAGKSIPNIYVPGLQTLKKGDVFAIEPFVTGGEAAGYVVDGDSQTIFSIAVRKKTGDKEADAFAERVWNERKTLPFTPSWYAEEYGAKKLEQVLGKLVAKKVARGYPTLVEASGNPVAQFEHTLALAEEGLVVLT